MSRNSPRIMNITDPHKYDYHMISTSWTVTFLFPGNCDLKPTLAWWALQLDVTRPMVRPQGYRPSRHHPPSLFCSLIGDFGNKMVVGDELGEKNMGRYRWVLQWTLSYWGSRSLCKIRNWNIIPVAPLDHENLGLPPKPLLWDVMPKNANIIV